MGCGNASRAMSPGRGGSLPAMSDTAQSLNLPFTAPIEKDGAFRTYVTVPRSDKVLRTRRAVKVGGTIDGQPFAARLMPSGTGPRWLPLRAAICKAIGKSQAGD